MKPAATLVLALALAPGLGACIMRIDAKQHGHVPAPRRTISTPRAPEPVGPYSQAILAGDTLYAAGQIGIDPETSQMVEGGVVAETRQALENLRGVLGAAGFLPDDVVQAQVFLADLADYGAMNEVYADFFGGHRPARVALQAAALPKGARVEIQVVAVRRD